MQLQEHITADIIYTYFHLALDDVEPLVVWLTGLLRVLLIRQGGIHQQSQAQVR